MVQTAQSNFIKYEITSHKKKKNHYIQSIIFLTFVSNIHMKRNDLFHVKNLNIYIYIFVMGKKFQCIWHIRIGIEIHFIFHFIIVWNFF